jgi:hypothetical protein
MAIEVPSITVVAITSDRRHRGSRNMTTDLAFECLIVSQDPGVVGIMNKLLANLAISTNVCPTPATALDHLCEGATDLVIVDWQKDSPDLLQHINRSGQSQKPTVMVVSETSSPAPGMYSPLYKPLTVESGAQSLRQAYSKLLQDYRQHTRCVLTSSLIAKNQYGFSIPIIVANICAEGVGLSTKEFLSRGDLLSFSIPLPGTELPIAIEARVLWMSEYGATGCEIASIAQADRLRLGAWLEQKCQVKKPLVQL